MLTILTLSICTLIVCLVIAALRGTQQTPDTAAPPSTSEVAVSPEEPTSNAPVELTITATSFDPKSDNGSGDENPDQTAFAIDGDPGTGWSTARYRNKPELGGEKPGVGLVLDLGTEASVASVDVLFADRGEDVELRVPAKEGLTAAPMERQDQWRIVASATDTEAEVGLTPDQPVRTRFLLVYLTKLPEVGEARFLATINELVVHQG